MRSTYGPRVNIDLLQGAVALGVLGCSALGLNQRQSVEESVYGKTETYSSRWIGNGITVRRQIDTPGQTESDHATLFTISGSTNSRLLHIKGLLDPDMKAAESLVRERCGNFTSVTAEGNRSKTIELQVDSKCLLGSERR